MQPVLEFVKRHSCSYTYSIRAPSIGEEVSEPCYLDLGHTSLAACLLDAAEALSIDFPRVQVPYQGMWMGEMAVRELVQCAESIAHSWMATDEGGDGAGKPSGMVAAVDLPTTA